MFALTPKKAAVVVTPDGWTTIDPDGLRFLTGSDPPRPGAYWRQLNIDARHWPPIAFWMVGTGLIVLAVVVSEWLIIPGVAILALYLHMFMNIARSGRDHPLATGIVAGFEPNPLLGSLGRATARQQDGQQIPVCFPICLIAEPMKVNGAAEVLFTVDPQAEMSWVIAARPAPRKEP